MHANQSGRSRNRRLPLNVKQFLLTHSHLPPSLEIPRGMGVSKAKLFKGMYGAKLEIPGWWGVQTKKPSMGEVWIFSGTTQLVEYWVFLFYNKGREVRARKYMYMMCRWQKRKPEKNRRSLNTLNNRSQFGSLWWLSKQWELFQWKKRKQCYHLRTEWRSSEIWC